MPAFPNFSFPTSQTHANNAFAPAQIDFSKIGQLYDSYADAQNNRMKQDAFQSQQAAAQEERNRKAQARQVLAKGFKRDAQQNPDFYAMADDLIALDQELGSDFLKMGSQEADRRYSREFDQKKFDAEQAYRRQTLEQGRSKAETLESREAAAAARGWDKDDPNIRAWIMTGNLPSRDMLKMTPTEQKELWKSQDEITGMDSQIEQLEKAVALNPDTYTGLGASTRTYLGTKLPDWMVHDSIASPDKSERTALWENIMNSEAVKAMSETLKGASTDYEMKKFISLMADPSQPPIVRQNAAQKVLSWAKNNRNMKRQRVEAIDPSGRYGGVPSSQSESPQPAPSGVGGAPIRARNPQTGEQIEWNGQQWVPVQ